MSDTNGGSLEPLHVHEAAIRASAKEVPVNRDLCEAALTQIDRWVTGELSSKIAGLADARFLRGRRKVFARIDSFVATSAPHARFRRERIARRVRDAAGSTLGLEDERTLFGLEEATDASSQEEWFARHPIPAEMNPPKHRTPGPYRLRALILLDSTRPPET